MKNHKTLLLVGCCALNILLPPAGQAQTTNICDGCTISSTYDNLSNNVFIFVGTNASLLTGFDTTFFNEGTVEQSGSGGLIVGGYNENVYFNNEHGGTYQFASDSSIFNQYPGNDNAVFTNQGLIWKSAGTNYSAIEITFNNLGGSIEVDSGALYLGGGDSSNGVFEVASNAMLDLTSGGTPIWAGEMSGGGSGTVSLADGSITGSPSLTLDFTNDIFQWDGGALEGIITNNGIVTITGTNFSWLTGYNATFYNQGTVRQIGSGGLTIGAYSENDYFNNEPGATYQFASDSSILNYEPGYDNPVFTNQGLIWKSGGTNYSGIEIPFYNQGGSIEVDSGTLYLSGGGTSSNGVFNVASGAVLDLTGGNTPTWAGQMSGSGSGTVSLADGSITGSPSLTLDFTNDLFQWEGGVLGGTIINHGLVTISGTNVSTLTGFNATFLNQGTVRQIGSGGSEMETFDGNIYFINEPGATYQFASDSSLIFNYGVVGYGASPSPFTNYGLVWKSAGTGTSAISLSFNNQGGVVEVDSGTLVLDGGGGSSNGDFEVAADAVLDLTGGGSTTWAGEMTGSGFGTVLLGENGTITGNPSLTLDFTNSLFQWAGGQFEGTIINHGLVTISGTNASTLTGYNAAFFNYGTVQQIGSGGSQMETFDGNISFINEPGGTYQFASDSSLIFNYGMVGYGASPSPFTNYGLVWKSAAAGTSVISLAFCNQGGTIEVDIGRLVLNGGGVSSSGVFEIGSGAVLDVTGGSAPTWSGLMSGSGSGTVSLAAGIITANPNVTLNFPPNLFQWDGGALAGVITNNGTVTISGTNASLLTGGNSTFYNQGTVEQIGSGGLIIGGYSQNVFFNNAPGAVYQITSDSSILDDVPGYDNPVFSNFGLVRKSGGTNTSSIAGFANTGGSVEVDSGTLAIGSFTQGGGSLTIGLGGANSNQCGQVVVRGTAGLGGPLNVFLANGFVPAVGDQFYILTSALIQGTFSSLNVPAGMTVTNLLNGSGLTEYVVLLVTNTVTGPVKILSPQVSNGSFSFNFATISGQSYTVQQNTDLSTTNWVSYTNLTGNGSIIQVITPSTIVPENFFRVLEP